jgi:hypothetical protein
MMTCWSYPFLTKRKTFATYRWCTYNRWQIVLIPVVSSNDMTYENMVSVTIKNHNIHMKYIITYPLTSARAINATRIVLHTLRERIHILRERPQDIPRSPLPRWAVTTSQTMDMESLPHDRNCPQANLVLRGQVRDSHHPTGGSSPYYLVIGALLQKVNYTK